MRESNFAFPAQNRACVCITSQLYDRRALDTTSALPLFNSLTHLTYLTSTSPRIREIMTMDGGLERLVRILHDFCICPPPPDNPAMLYGLSPPNARPPKLIPTLNPQSFDKHAAYRFSLAFQCVVNIGVRGSEPIRSRVVQAGTLDVVGCILEAWLANKGFAVGPSSSATGMPRETREQRQARRLAQAEQRERDQALELARALQRQIQVEEMERMFRVQRPSTDVDVYGPDDEPMDVSPGTGRSNQLVLLSVSIPGPSNPNSDTDIDTSTDTSTNATPIGSNTPTGAVVVASRDRSGTIIARPVWDELNPNGTTPLGRHRTHRAHHNREQQQHTHRENRASPTPSPDTSRPDTETEDDGDGDVDMDRVDRTTIGEASPSPERHPPHLSIQRERGARRAVGIVSDVPTAAPLQVNLNTDAHIIINDAQGGEGGVEGGVEDGIVSLEPNDDFAMGAPPGAPGAIDEGNTPRTMNAMVRAEERRRGGAGAPDVTPRAGLVGLPPMVGPVMPEAVMHGRGTQTPGHQRNGTLRGRGAVPVDTNTPTATTATPAATATATPSVTQAGGGAGAGRTSSGSANHHHRDSDSGPYRDEDVLLSLQLLAYLSKYPHVRQAFYKPRVTFHPASVNLQGARYGVGVNNGGGGGGPGVNGPGSRGAAVPPVVPVKESLGFFRALAGRGKEKERAVSSSSAASATATSGTQSSSSSSSGGGHGHGGRQTNVFSLVERFTFRPSSTETELPNPPPKLPPEIQYWAGVIMRNACRKDESRGGIRQCANMLCGRWESFPREFAKCRRCRKAKYCGKECQSTAWSEGHRFWCSAKDGDEDATGEAHVHGQGRDAVGAGVAIGGGGVGVGVGGETVGVGVGGVEVAGGDDAGIAGVGAGGAVLGMGMGIGMGVGTGTGTGMTAGGTITGRRERHARERTFMTLGGGGESRGVRTHSVVQSPAFGVAPVGGVRAEGSTMAREREREREQERERERDRSAQMVPSQPTRTRTADPADIRTYGRLQNPPNATANGRVDASTSTYLEFDYGVIGQDQGVRRRAETVTSATISPPGASSSSGAAGGLDLLGQGHGHHPPLHHLLHQAPLNASVQQGLQVQPQQQHPRLQPVVERYFAQAAGSPTSSSGSPVIPTAGECSPGGSGSGSGSLPLGTPRAEAAGPSRRRRGENGFRSTVGEHDMILG